MENGEDEDHDKDEEKEDPEYWDEAYAIIARASAAPSVRDAGGGATGRKRRAGCCCSARRGRATRSCSDVENDTAMLR